MKTTLPLAAKFTISSKATTIAIHAFLLLQQSARAITRYYFWFFSVLIFFSCQRNLTPTTTLNKTIPIETTVTSSLVAEKSIAIDTLELSNRVPRLSPKQSSLSAKIQYKVKSFYIANGLKTKWLNENGPNEFCYALIDQLKNASAYGLSSQDYATAAMAEKLNKLTRTNPVVAKEANDLDIHLTEMFFLFTKHLRDGRITAPGDVKNIWLRESKNENHSDITLLAEIKNAGQLKEVLQQLQPAQPQYAKLQKALEYYRSLEKSDAPATPTIRSSERIKPFERHPAIVLVRKKLSATDLREYTVTKDSITGLADSLYYEASLVAAVKTFQERHGLEADGIIGEKTIKFLNQSFQEKADLIALNMERLRWLPENLGDHFIIVNIPEYKLRIYKQEKQTLEMKVIVGSIQNPTPVFHDSLEHIVFSPTWTVPPSIMEEEIFPRLIKDSLHYSGKNFSFYKNGIEINPATERWDSITNVYQYRVVQKPGPDNSLGLVKFVMPNNMNIYLHDTPDHRAFGKTYRALSHGCIRLDDPARLAAYLLQEQRGWDAPTIDKAMNATKPAQITLTKHYQVHLQYNTVWVDDNGNINFREDIYGHDKRQLQQLKPVRNTITPSAVASL
jgi:murein L,D-transpeptidase YcbB/YkuD